MDASPENREELQDAVKMGFGITAQNDISNETPYQLNTGQSFGDINSDPSKSQITLEYKNKIIEQTWNPMTGTFNVVEGS